MRSSLVTSHFIVGTQQFVNHPYFPQKMHLQKCLQGDLCEMK